MAKGIAKRRRMKRALEAARGNLHKIQNGKGLPVSLPEAPKQNDAEKLPASLRKMLALKVGKKRDKQNAGAGDDDGPSTSGRGEASAAAAQRQPKEGGRAVKGANPFTEQFVDKKLKAKKKEYLKRKQEKKQAKGGQEVVVEKELELKHRDKVKFGEVVHAPLEVHLKRKHWADQERSANDRCKEIFLKQMQQAQQRMSGGAAAADEGLALAARAGGRAAKPLSGAAGGAGPAPGKGKKRKAPIDSETEAIRQQLIDSYRAAKKGGGFHHAAVGNATMNSLAKLVGKGGAGGGGAHTLG
ncbi:hypothetical protein GPECTOR_226g496 [Gonium pectorale]|uniref:Uncharacterized protein n=1 Tax=Gonium pectorale TaxID=33097 RepID=A0A150FWL6_GONPE|nr:hypothetical protein GPECTOR_226g496 [Gonium pectorale]|eukprot:KXZ42001.1 hypothetical protein GPECTOR_226g496 [Gonium pectorale]